VCKGVDVFGARKKNAPNESDVIAQPRDGEEKKKADSVRKVR
jgi:hypothetical protein